MKNKLTMIGALILCAAASSKGAKIRQLTMEEAFRKGHFEDIVGSQRAQAWLEMKKKAQQMEMPEVVNKLEKCPADKFSKAVDENMWGTCKFTKDELDMLGGKSPSKEHKHKQPPVPQEKPQQSPTDKTKKTEEPQQPPTPSKEQKPGMIISQPTQSVTVDPDQLVQWAEKDGLGYKTANLLQLSQLVQSLNGKLPANYECKCLNFTVLTKQVDSILKRQGVDVDQEWATIVQNTVTQDMKSTHVVTQEFVKACEELAKKIEEAFNDAAHEIQFKTPTFAEKNKCWINLQDFGLDLTTTENIETLIASLNPNTGLVTLRSTGLREDTEKVANAGGNESCEAVRITLADIFRAMGTVPHHI